MEEIGTHKIQLFEIILESEFRIHVNLNWIFQFWEVFELLNATFVLKFQSFS